MNSLKVIATDTAPQAIGPYSQAIRCGNLLFVSGQIAIEPQSGKAMASGSSIRLQCEQVLKNLEAILNAAGVGLSAVVKTTVYLTSMQHFQAMNEVYAEKFGSHRPARATVAVSALPAGVDVEIEAIAQCG